jgi:hypothetical protein
MNAHEIPNNEEPWNQSVQNTRSPKAIDCHLNVRSIHINLRTAIIHRKFQISW